MKKIILSAILFLGLASTGFSQERALKSPEERAQRITDGLDKKLSLTESQKTQIYQINLERAQAMSSAKGDKKGIDKTQFKAQIEASESRILSVLNTDQRTTYNQLKAERQEKMKNHQGDRKKGPKGKKA
ncbi:MAG: hypothetical protein H7Y07_13740 [Pyrinomonadaceae bacterium]|nr:hypothetical protein [Sphingobacteriaceae bacterium]